LTWLVRFEWDMSTRSEIERLITASISSVTLSYFRVALHKTKVEKNGSNFLFQRPVRLQAMMCDHAKLCPSLYVMVERQQTETDQAAILADRQLASDFEIHHAHSRISDASFWWPIMRS
jgi:hypothetical protein